MKQLGSFTSDRASSVETECTERGNTSDTVARNLPSEVASKNLQDEGMDKVENYLVDLKSPRDKQSEEDNESVLGGVEETFKMSPTCSVGEDQDLTLSESDDTKRQEIQTDICNSEFSQTEKKIEESSSICSGVNYLLVSDSVSVVDEEVNLTQVSDNRPSSSEGESSSLKDGDVPLTDLSKTDSMDNSEDTNPAYNKQQDSLSDGVTYNKAEQETTFISIDCESSENRCVGDSTSENNAKPCPSACQYELSMQNGSKCNKSPSNTIEQSISSPVHFQKKIKKMEILRNPTKTHQKRKKKTLEIVTKDTSTSDVDTAIFVEEDNSSPIIANGLHLNEDTRECSSESLFTRHQRSSLNDADKSNCFSKTSNTGDTNQKFLVSADSTSSDSECSTSSDKDYYYYRQKYQRCIKHTLNIFVFLATVFALVTGTCLRSVISSQDYHTIFYLRLPGQLFTNVLQMLSIPLIVSSLISNLASFNTCVSRRICLRTLLYYLITSFIALITGIILAVTIQPGEFVRNLAIVKQPIPKVNTLDVMLDLLRNIFPDNLLVACFKRFRTEQLEVTNNNHTAVPFGTAGASMVPTQSWRSESGSTFITTTTNDISNETVTKQQQQVPITENIYITTTTSVMDALQDHPGRFEPFLTQTDGTNLLGLVMYSLMMGMAIRCVREQGRVLADIFTAFYQSTLKLICFITWFSPIGIFFLLTADLIELEEPSSAFHQLALYTGTALVALLGHGIIILPLIYFLMSRKSPVRFLYGNSLSIFTAFATSCSITALPVMLQCVECKTKLRHQVTRFTLPLGAIINTNAAVLYKSVACIFIAQYEGVSVTIGRLIIISITSMLVSIGTRNIPQHGNLGLLAVLTAASIPNENVSLILAADWILHRVGVTVNAIADVIGAGVIHHLTSRDDID